ncbi:hypothetical protein [Kribbella pittospori]|uniref:hypothetical protein n=1 Tax=Kribbella pittospori TaxID=722689 RepID=UPI0013F3FCAE|nr:hypothetical protein [Kribbella pittospori]
MPTTAGARVLGATVRPAFGERERLALRMRVRGRALGTTVGARVLGMRVRGRALGTTVGARVLGM